MASMSLPPYKASVFGEMVKGVKDHPKEIDVNLSGKTLLITGSNSGIGAAFANIVPRLGISVLIMAVRRIEKGEEAARPIRQAYPACNVMVWELDMLSYESIQNFARRCSALPRLDIAILNAGIGFNPKSSINPSTGHEETFQVNYLSTALLSVLLLPILAASPQANRPEPGRLTIVGSGTALFCSFENRKANPIIPSFDIPFSGIPAASERYGVSKLLVMGLVDRLSQYVPADKVIINTIEPGLTSSTSLHRDFTGAAKYLAAGMKRLTAKKPEEAAWKYVDAMAVHGKESHGAYIMFGKVSGFPPVLHDSDGKMAMERLWEETLTELEFAGVKQSLGSMKV